MKAKANLRTPRHGLIDIDATYGTIESITANEAEHLMKEIRAAINQVNNHNKPPKKLGEY